MQHLAETVQAISDIAFEYSLHEKYLYSEFFWSLFSSIQSECGNNTDQKHS